MFQILQTVSFFVSKPNGKKKKQKKTPKTAVLKVI